MKERPILFNGEMVRAVLAGVKTQTRRVMHVQPPRDDYKLFKIYSSTEKRIEGKRHWALLNEGGYGFDATDERFFSCPYGVPGDRLWVRETFQYTGAELNIDPGYVYRATDPDWSEMEGWTWKPSIFMPRAASRILLEVVDVRVERVQEIKEEDAKAEGCILEREVFEDKFMCKRIEMYRESFLHLWDSINAKRGYGWDVNPWVWVVEFRRVEP